MISRDEKNSPLGNGRAGRDNLTTGEKIPPGVRMIQNRRTLSSGLIAAAEVNAGVAVTRSGGKDSIACRDHYRRAHFRHRVQLTASLGKAPPMSHNIHSPALIAAAGIYPAGGTVGSKHR